MTARSPLAAAVFVLASLAAADERPAPPDGLEGASGFGQNVRLGVVWMDVNGTAPWAFPRAAREITDLLGRIGVTVLMRKGAAGDVVSEHEVFVVLLERRPVTAGIARDAMGASSTKAAAHRSVLVFASEVARTLGLGWPPGGWSPAEQGDFTVGVARVAGHELVHVVTGEISHAPRGLMAARFDRARLLGPDLLIADATAAAFRSAVGTLRPPVLSAEARAAAGVPAVDRVHEARRSARRR